MLKQMYVGFFMAIQAINGFLSSTLIQDHEIEQVFQANHLSDTGQYILMVEPCLSSHVQINEALKKGYIPVVLNANSDHRKIPEKVLEKVALKFEVDTNDDEKVINMVKRLKKYIHFSAVVPGSEYYVPLTAKVAQELHLLGLTPEAALRARRKDLMRESLTQRGVQNPLFQKVSDPKNLSLALKKVGCPCIIKPIDFAGSVNVKKVHNVDEAEAAFKAILAHKGVDKEWGNRKIENAVLVEEYICGPEYSIEGFVNKQKINVVSMTEKFLSPEPDFVEVGHVVRGQLPSHSETIEKYIQAVVEALELDYGPFHAEVRISDKGPVLMEIAMRLAGDYIPRLIELATGVNYYENNFLLLMGQSLKLDRPKNTNIGITFFYRPDVEKINSNQYFHQILSRKDVLDAKPYYQEGDTIPAMPMEKHKLGYAIVEGQDVETLKKSMEEIEAKAQF